MPQENRNRIQNEKFTLQILDSEEELTCEDLKTFDCGLEDLNDFFRNDVLGHKRELLAETYYFQPRKATEEGLFFPVAFVSFLNDSISVTRDERKEEKKGFWKIIKKAIPYKMLYPAYPAVKIGRLGVKNKYQGQNFGTALINLSKNFFLTDNRTGCRFITVDAYNEEQVIKFYEKNGFQFLWEMDKNNKTRIMFFDLKRHNIKS